MTRSIGSAPSRPAPSGELVAVIERKGRFLTARPLFWRAPAAEARRADAQPLFSLGSPRSSSLQALASGDLALIAIGARGRARALRRIGRPERAQDVIEALLLEHGMRRGFGGKAQGEAAGARESFRRRQGATPRGGRAQGADPATERRRDLRELPTFTVDPASARDFDDAISAQERGDGSWKVWVHIADVSAFVGEGSALDREARRRANSVYLPGTSEPMLPEELSGDLCSLRQDEDRWTLSVELDIAGEQVRAAAFCRSLIRSDARLTYEQADAMLAAGPGGGHIAASLTAARRAAEALAAARRARGSLQVESFEPDISFDAAGRPRISIRAASSPSATSGAPDSDGQAAGGRAAGAGGAERGGGGGAAGDDAPPSPARMMIEQLMIAANEAVAAHLQAARLPCLYRVHERPRPERVELLLAQLASLAVPTPPAPDPMSASQAAELMAEIALAVQRELSRRAGQGRIAFGSLLLRTLQQAIYSPRNIGHAGLASSAYCHFTSPIRRYPDIVCHRALLASLGQGAAPAPAGLEELGEWCSERERQTMVLEREGDDIVSCFALEQLLHERGADESFTGEVVGLIGGGAFIAFGAERPGGLPRFEGMLPARALGALCSATGGSGAAGAAHARESSGGERDPGTAARKGTGKRQGSAAGRYGTQARHGATERLGAIGRSGPAARPGGPPARDWWELNEQGTELSAEGSGWKLRLGQQVQVAVERIDTLAGKVQLAAAGQRREASAGDAPAGRPGPRGGPKRQGRRAAGGHRRAHRR